MKKNIILIIWATLLALDTSAQFAVVTHLNPVPITSNLKEKPQSKVWTNDGRQWTVLMDSSGTYLRRLDGTTWTKVLKLSTGMSGKPDCKVVGNITHIFIFKGLESKMVSVEYVPASHTYKLWTARTSTVSLALDSTAGTATIDIDSNSRMWLAYDDNGNIYSKWSDAPYTTWSAPITIASGVNPDDISALISLPVAGKVGILWSNQNTKRFGFKTHIDGTDPAKWSTDEVPASQSAIDAGMGIGHGMADNHLNMAIASDGTLYCAVKTSYDRTGYTKLALLIRRPAGIWDNLYEISQTGTRPIVLLNELLGRLKIIYTSVENGGDILYKESPMSNISFSPQFTLISGKYNYSSSMKMNYSTDIVILASSETEAVGVLATDIPPLSSPNAPTLVSPTDVSTGIAISPTLNWDASNNATSYQLQVSTTSGFATTVFDQSGITATSALVSGLLNNTGYYWRVRATNAAGSSSWSSAWSFTTVGPVLPVPDVPILLSPTNATTGAAVSPTLNWSPATNAASYQVQVSTTTSFSTTVFDQSGIGATSTPVSSLLNSTVYYWRVKASNAAGTSNWSSAWSFTTIKLAAPTGTLVGHWEMDESNGATLSDVSDYGNTATTKGSPARVTGISGLALNLNGTNQYATALNSASLNITNAITLSAWIKPEKSGTSQILIKKGLTGATDGYELSLTSTGKFYFRFNQVSNGEDYRLNSVSSYPTDGNTWMHIAATYDGTSIKLYVNGVIDKSKTYSSASPINTNTLPLAIGAQSDGTSRFQGSIDEVKIYNTALNASEITTLAASPSSRTAARKVSAQEETGIKVNQDFKIYPNPIVSKATIQFILPEDNEYTIALYDFKGSRVTIFKQGTAKAGELNTVNIDVSNLTWGLYLVRLQANTVVKTLRVMLDR